MDSNFAMLLDRVRQGDQDAATELVNSYEPVVREAVRAWFRKSSFIPLQRIVDSADICQSVLAQFFRKASAHEFDLESPNHLKNLLLVMARNRFVHHIRSNQFQRRDIRRAGPLSQVGMPEPAVRETPSDSTVEEELLAMIRASLTPEERELADRRARGETWREIVFAMGGTPDGRRVQLARVEVRIIAEFELGNSEAGT